MFKERCKRLCFTIITIVVLVAIGLWALKFFAPIPTNISEIQLSNEEAEMFKKYFGIEKPRYLHVLQCVAGQDETMTYFAIKAVISTSNIILFTNEISNVSSTVYKYKDNRTPIADDFAQTLPWWNIESGRHISSRCIQFDYLEGAAALTIVRDKGCNYVYIWYTNPALIAK